VDGAIICIGQYKHPRNTFSNDTWHPRDIRLAVRFTFYALLRDRQIMTSVDFLGTEVE